MSRLTTEETLNLNKLISEYDAEDNTAQIRKLKHSPLIFADIQKMETLKKSHAALRSENPDAFRDLVIEHTQFLFNNYGNIFNRLLNDEMDLDIMGKFLVILRMIEDGRCNQHEGSVAIGKLLKELYLDSAVRVGENLDKKYQEEAANTVEPEVEARPISWQQWQKKREEIIKNLGELKK